MSPVHKEEHRHEEHHKKSAPPEVEPFTYTPPSITASGTTFAQFQAGGVNGHLERLLAAQPGTSNPSAAATATATGGGSTGGNLAAGTYYFVCTETNGLGETLPSPVSAQLTVAAGNIPQITFASLQSGNIARNVYVGTVNGPAAGPFALYAANVSAATLNMPTPAGSGPAPPAKNTTAPPNCAPLSEMVRAAERGNLQDLWRFVHSVVTGWNAGRPTPTASLKNQLLLPQTALAMFATLINEIGVLVDANPGTLGRYIDPIGNSVARRTWP
jgi:hypothetical protein